MIHLTKPKNFNSRFEIVSCFVENNGKILLLHRQDHKPEGNTWGVPAGKIDLTEDHSSAMARELAEETGIVLPANRLAYFDKAYVQYPDYAFIYHIFHTKLEKDQKVKINPTEHKNFQWVFPSDAPKFKLIQDLDSCIKLFFNL